MSEKKNTTVQCKETIFLQFNGKEMSLDEIRTSIKKNYDSVKKGNDVPESLEIYLKPEDRKAYYVINDDFAGEVELFLK